ncbi:MAG: tRNA pseudouridine(38-40) synthase TruA [Leptonema sp. (in: bacteria)]
MKHTYGLTIAYDGLKYHGMQYQKDQITVQKKIEDALEILFKKKIKIAIAGRTDSGVHATGQVISFKTPIPILDPEKFANSVNALAGPAISVIKFHKLPLHFHARFDCIAREYEYLIYAGKKKPILLENYVWHIEEEIDLFVIQEEIREILGEREFKSFSRRSNENSVRFLEYFKIEKKMDCLMGFPLFSIQIRGNAFLHNMVRILVGTIIDRIQNRINLTLKEILDLKDRTKAGKTAPSYGLYFRKAYYPKVPDLLDSGLELLDSYPIFGSSYYKNQLQNNIRLKNFVN